MKGIPYLLMVLFLTGCATPCPVCPPKDIVFPARVHGIIPGQVLVIPFQMKKGDVDKIIEMQKEQKEEPKKEQKEEENRGLKKHISQSR